MKMFALPEKKIVHTLFNRNENEIRIPVFFKKKKEKRKSN